MCVCRALEQLFNDYSFELKVDLIGPPATIPTINFYFQLKFLLQVYHIVCHLKLNVKSSVKRSLKKYKRYRQHNSFDCLLHCNERFVVNSFVAQNELLWTVGKRR